MYSDFSLKVVLMFSKNLQQLQPVRVVPLHNIDFCSILSSTKERYVLHSTYVQLLATPRVEVFLSGNMSLQRGLHGAAPLCIEVAAVFDRTVIYF